MEQATSITTIAHVIQLSVAPVFLLLAIGSMLTVMTNRLGRVIDRAHFIERPQPNGDQFTAHLADQLLVLSRRAKLANAAISLFTVAALLVCTVIAILFLGALLDFNVGSAVAILFIAAMLAFIAGLGFFLREIRVATASLCIGLRP